MKNLLPLLLVLGSTAYAQNNTSNIQVNAKITSGCTVSGDNAIFSIVQENIRTNMDLRLQCSKTVPVTLTASSKVNPKNTYGQFMTIGKKPLTSPITNSPDAIHYFINTSEVVTNSKYTVTTRPNSESLFVNYDHRDYRLVMTINTSEQVTLPLKAQITIYNDFMKLIPGDYADDAVYSLVF